MKTLPLLIFASLLAILAANPSFADTPAGKPASAATDVFTEVEISGGFQVEWRPGAPLLVIEAEAEDRPYIVTRIRDGRLEIHWSRQHQSHGDVRVRLGGPALSEITISGAVRFDATGLDAQLARLEVSGASRLKVTGQTATLSVNVSGASRLDASGLVVDVLHIDLSGASRAQVNATRELRGDVSGTSKLSYASTDAQVNIRPSGASTIQRLP